MTGRNRIFTSVAAATIALVLISLTSLQAAPSDKTVRQTSIIHQIVTGLACLGEDVILTGTARTTSHVSMDGNGGAHLMLHENRRMSGVGLSSGDEYEMWGPSHWSTSDRFLVNPPIVASFVRHHHLRRTSDGIMFSLKEHVHLTMNPNGSMTSEIELSETSCQ